MLLLNVPYSEKDAAKALGAKWDPTQKVWLAPGRSYEEYEKFSRWFDGDVIVQHAIYLVETSRVCWKCQKVTKLVCFAMRDYVDVHSRYPDDLYLMTSMISKMPEEVLRFVQSRYNFKEKYSKTADGSYWANCCSHCDSLQGNNYLFYEPFESPFYADTEEKARNLTLYQVRIPLDMCVDLGATFPFVITSPAAKKLDVGSMIARYARHKVLDIVD